MFKQNKYIFDKYYSNQQPVGTRLTKIVETY